MSADPSIPEWDVLAPEPTCSRTKRAMTVYWTMLTPTTTAGAVGAVRLIAGSAGELGGALQALGLASPTRGVPRIGDVRLCDLLSIDRGLLVRWNEVCVDLFPHGGPLVQRQLLEALTTRGITGQPPRSRDWTARQPAAQDELEAIMLDTLARAASPRATQLLLEAPAQWRSNGEQWRGATPTPRDLRLNRLLEPPLVVLVGAANIGKSTLINALARRAVSIVDAQPGSTRDHVGVLLQLDGIVARVVDTPGLRATDDPIERDAQQTAMTMAAAADLLLLCGDASTAPPSSPLSNEVPSLRIALRADLGVPQWPHDAALSAVRQEGVDSLAVRIRQALVSDADLESVDPWLFWRP